MSTPFGVDEDGQYLDLDEHWRFLLPGGAADVSGMTSPVRCTSCGHVYDFGKITDYGRYLDCTTWRCPGCKVPNDDRPPGWGQRHYVELDADGRERRLR